MLRQQIIRRIRYLRNIEIWNIVSIPASLIIVMTQLQVTSWRMMTYNIIVLIFFFLQGAIYWDLKLNSLLQNKASLPDSFRANYRILRWMNVILISMYPILGLYGNTTNEPWLVTSLWSHAVFVATIIVHINYYHWQISHDNPNDLRYLTTHARLRRSPLNTDLYPMTVNITSPIHQQRRSSLIHNFSGRDTFWDKEPMNSQPIPTLQSQPIPTHQSQPIPTHQSQPIPTHQSQPIPTHQSQPIPTHQSQPIPTHQSQPIPTHQSQPIPTHQSQPIPTHHSQPIPTHQSQPIPTHQSQPIPTHQSQPIPTHQSQPIPTHQSQPIPTHQSQPIPTPTSMETQPLPILDDETIVQFLRGESVDERETTSSPTSAEVGSNTSITRTSMKALQNKANPKTPKTPKSTTPRSRKKNKDT